MPLDNTITWIQDVLVPRILKKDFRKATVENIDVRIMESMKDNWASQMYEINLLVNHYEGNKYLSFLLKLMSEDENTRNKLQSDKQFFNEIHFYSFVANFLTSQVILPNIKSDFENLMPVCYYTFYSTDRKPQNTEDAVLVLDNLKVRNFKLGNRTSLDFKHCSLALKSLGLFHAFSYFMKEQDRDKFMKLVVKPIQETKYDPKREEFINKVFGISIQRVVNGMIEELPEEDPKVQRLRTFSARNSFDVFKELIQPREPHAVLCHGDYLRNNILFRYDNDEPMEIKLIDFQTIRYASPAIDVSLLLCMNTTHEVRAVHFNDLLHVYHSSLTDTLSSLFRKPKDQLPEYFNFESFLADFRRHAAYGYMISIEFLPWMFAESDELEEFMKIYCTERGSSKHCELSKKLGGNNATRALVLLAKDLLDNKCI